MGGDESKIVVYIGDHSYRQKIMNFLLNNRFTLGGKSVRLVRPSRGPKMNEDRAAYTLFC